MKRILSTAILFGIFAVATYPFRHPVKVLKVVTYPVRHPVKTVK